MAKITLILGGVRSGKSKFAEDYVLSNGKYPVYLATAEAFDDEMQNRIDLHQSRRDAGWINCEAAIHLADTLLQNDSANKIILVDCLTVWLGNLTYKKMDISCESEKLLNVIPSLKADVVFVGSEVGLGIMPANAMSRKFGDDAGLLNQAIAAVADNVYFIAAGLPLKLKG